MMMNVWKLFTQQLNNRERELNALDHRRDLEDLDAPRTLDDLMQRNAENAKLSDHMEPVIFPGNVEAVQCSAGVIMPDADDPYGRVMPFARISLGGTNAALNIDAYEEACRWFGDWFHAVADEVGKRKINLFP